jgi:hypothetical protein
MDVLDVKGLQVALLSPAVMYLQFSSDSRVSSASNFRSLFGSFFS